MKSAFLPFDERLAIIDEVIKPGYAALGGRGVRLTVDARPGARAGAQPGTGCSR